MLENSDELQQVYQSVRETYFPRWDTRRKWVLETTMEFGCRVSEVGGYDRAAKTIVIGGLDPSPAAYHALLIEVLSHVVTGGGYTQKWRERMWEAVVVAQARGAQELADKLWEQITMERPRLTAARVYETIEEVVSVGSTTYEEVLGLMAEEHSTTPETLERRFRRCKQVYERAVRRAQGRPSEIDRANAFFGTEADDVFDDDEEP